MQNKLYLPALLGGATLILSACGGGGSSATPVVIAPSATNQAPVISGAPADTIQAGQMYSFTPTASDPEGDTLSFTASNLPGWASLNTQTGEITGQPSAADQGTSSDINLSVSDGSLSTDLAVFTITVEPQPNGLAAPKLNFSDLINGPDSGLGDGFGSGAIVTVWGQNLGDTQSGANLVFTDNSGTEHLPYIYYWKRADGAKPSGPADLWSSHRMQEIAFSIPDSANGSGTIRIERDGVFSNPLPFTVRPGNIYHVKAGGDRTADGSWDTPWSEPSHSLQRARPGDLIYVSDDLAEVTTGINGRSIYKSGNPAAQDNQYAITAYPGSHPVADSERTPATFYRTSGIVMSKFHVLAGNRPDPNSDDPDAPLETDGYVGRGGAGISGVDEGRIIANLIQDAPGRCPFGYGGALGSGVGGNPGEFNNGENMKVFGNQVKDYGCPQTDRFHHTTYFSIRNNDEADLEPLEVAWNHLSDNMGHHGLHFYDENITNQNGEPCGEFLDTVKIHNNVVVNQRGSAVNIGINCGNILQTDWHVYNNIFIEAGTGPDLPTNSTDAPTAISLTDYGMGGSLVIANNTIIGWGDNEQPFDARTNAGRAGLLLVGNGDTVDVQLINNMFVADYDLPLVANGFRGDVLLDNVGGGSNLHHWAGGAAQHPQVPQYDSLATGTDPLVTRDGLIISVETGSPATQMGRDVPADMELTHDIYGTPRTLPLDIGAVQVGR